jgi:hypothetical protein
MIEDDLLRRLKETAAKEGTTLGGLVNRLLRQAMTAKPKRRAYKLKLHGWDAKPQPGVDILDRDNLFDLMNGR